MTTEPRPVLVSGAHRSGTTWVGQTLCFSRELGYIQEPFNPVRRPSWTGDTFRRHGEYVGGENGERFQAPIADVLRFRFPLRGQLGPALQPVGFARLAREYGRSMRSRLLGARPLMKDPDALFSAPWLVQTFDMDAVVTIRHPAAVVGSMKRLNWRFEFEWWADQEPFMRDLAGPFADDILAFARDRPSLVQGGILYWNVVYDVVSRFRNQHPSWIFVRYEDLARAPVDEFRGLYRRLGLAWTAKVSEKIVRYTSAGNPVEKRRGNARFSRRDSRATVALWRQRLDPEEIKAVLEGTSEVASRFYSEEELRPQ